MPFEQKLDDGICKAFKKEHGVDLFVNKAIDEDANQHLLLVYIPKDEQLGVEMLMNPIPYASEKERDEAYVNNINDEFANAFYEALKVHIQQKKSQND